MINGNQLSLILLATNACNAACEYCFEDKTSDSLSLERLQLIIAKVLDHMAAQGMRVLSINWQGGEAMLLPPDWYREAHAWIDEAAARRGKVVHHGLQTNLLAYSPAWNGVIAEMFGNSLSTSLDVPNRHRRVAGHDTAHYDALWSRKVTMAREAGIDVKVISVINPGTLEMGAERFYTHLVDELGITDFQINTPFPGGADNPAKQSLTLDPTDLARFHCELADIWLERGPEQDVSIGPFDQLMNVFLDRDSCLPCIWSKNCADELIAIDPRGEVAQCDCWVTSYPGYVFGNVFECENLTGLLQHSRARRQFADRPMQLLKQAWTGSGSGSGSGKGNVQADESGDCIACDYLALCHGGCPVRTYSMRSTLLAKDPYCALYQSLFRHMEQRASHCGLAQ
ncbi:radical SAM/SPASM domain-containing protein [Rhabdochromatium marinum]|uniref:radical SAM/SPASM domain-containing protein n=1 Tax=Rhabdochromatium marinum TaxID=48729 RepID=UPI0019054A86|nr:radical SAM protein [Rhabdochromatium marinum]MBK1650206.1 SPASM domain-containing protein [Rhabdochromatium marinum]